ncbi:hypothetical protein DL771_006019 [Monosporascus sp. 5C6A]|nr:hypothetical protein DL771_006019 [Monosporascus sp. 5C6A]
MSSATTTEGRRGAPPPRPRREINMDHSWADLSSDSSSGRGSARRRRGWFARLVERLRARFGGRSRREVSEIVTRS